MDIDEYAAEYVAAGGQHETLFRRGFADSGRLGINGEMAGIPDSEEAREAYRLGGWKAAEHRRKQVEESMADG